MDLVPGYFRRDVRLWYVYYHIYLGIRLHICAVAASVILTQWRTRLRRQMNERDIVSVHDLFYIIILMLAFFKATRGIHTDCLLNYETVKYFGGEEHEGERYREAIREYQALEYKVISMCITAIRYIMSQLTIR